MTVKTIYFIHHSHTDIGYTHDQPILLDLEERFISDAVRLADKYAERTTHGAFRWTVETTYVLDQWLRHAPQHEVDRFLALERAGRIEVTGMFVNITPLYDADELVESLQLLQRLRTEYGLTIRHAMNCDVNGQNWPVVDVLLDAGIEAFSMAINTHFGGYPFERPNAFWWQGPSGRKLLTWNGWPYDHGWRFGIGRDQDEFAETWWPRIQTRLDEIGYDLPILMIQSYHPFGDNGTAFEGFVEYIDAWNEAGRGPEIRFATPTQWWDALRALGDRLPTARGDWTDYWNFGCISSAREQTINRQSRTRLRNADAVAGTLAAGGADHDPWLAGRMARYRDAAWTNVIFWDEHTWGADMAVRGVYAEDTASQWHHKADYAYKARSQSLMLQRDALAALARVVQREEDEDLLVVNPLPWAQEFAGLVTPPVLEPRGTRDDTTAGRHFQDRTMPDPIVGARHTIDLAELPQERTVLPPTIIPAFGYKVVKRSELQTFTPSRVVSEESVVETARHRLVFDREQGGLRSWFDKELSEEWVDPSAPFTFGSFVHEEVADRGHPWPRRLLSQMDWDPESVERKSLWQQDWHARRRTPSQVLSHKVYHTPLGVFVVQTLDAPGCEGPLVQQVFIPLNGIHLEFTARFRLGLDAHPQATYLAFPFDIPTAHVHLDLGGQAIEPGSEQLPGSCMDYHTVQNWVDFSSTQVGMTVATPDNPMVQLGDFHFGRRRREATLARPMLLGWLTNTYWETNFRAHQPGLITARYVMHPHRGPFDEAAAHRVGQSALHATPLVQQMGEPSTTRSLPAEGTLLNLPDGPVQVLHIKAATDGDGLIVRLLNAADDAQTATIGSALFRIADAETCDLMEQCQDALALTQGGVNLSIAPRRIAVVRLRGAIEG